MITALYRFLHLLGHWRLSRWLRDQAQHPDDLGGATRPGRIDSHRRSTRLNRRMNHLRAVAGDAGMTTAEYAVGTVAAVAFAVVLFKVVQSPAVHAALASVVTGALHVKM